MKYLVFKDLLDENNILSHLFLNCLTKEQLAKVRDKNVDGSKPFKEVENTANVEIEVIIDGISVNPKAFFELYAEQYDSFIKEEANKIVKAQFSDRLNELARKIDDYTTIVETWSENINWNIKNPFLRKIGEKIKK